MKLVIMRMNDDWLRTRRFIAESFDGDEDGWLYALPTTKKLRYHYDFIVSLVPKSVLYKTVQKQLEATKIGRAHV